MKRIVPPWVPAILVLLASSVFLPLSAQAADVTVDIPVDSVLERNYLGIGIQWEPYEIDITEEDWNLIFQRVDFARPPILRVMVCAFFYCTGFDGAGNPVYNWNSDRMRALCRILDYAQSRNIEVEIGEWDDPSFKPSPLQAYNIQETDPRWARMIADFLDQIHNVKGYSVVKYYNMINEPNGYWSGNASFDSWKTAIDNLHAELSSRGYLSWITLAGPDTTGDDSWVNHTVDRLRDKIGLYQVHRYARLSDVTSGALENQMRARRDYIRANDPQGSSKRFWMAEAGMEEGKIEPDTQTNRYHFTYGVWMADYVIQTIRAGQAGAIAWDLDDAMHNGGGYGSLNLKGWGFWNIIGGRHGYPASDRDIRPWYYPWSLLSRSFPRGCQTLNVPRTGISGLRVAAAKIPGGGGDHLSFAIVNNSDTPRSVRIVVPGAQGATTLAKYHYFDDDRPANDNGFPVVKERLTDVDLQDGIDISLSSRGAVILTTLEVGTPIPLLAVPAKTPPPIPAGTLVDNLNDWENVHSFSSNLTLDGSNTKYFDGDTSRIKRTSDTIENVIYHRPNITTFKARVCYERAIAGRVKFYSSPDSVNWTPLKVTRDAPDPTAENWHRTTFRPAGGPLHTGIHYIKIELLHDSKIYTPQLAQMTLHYKGSLKGGVKAGKRGSLKG